MKISFIAKLANFILKKTKPSYMDSQSDVEEFLLKKSNQQKKHVKSIFKSFDFNGMQVFTIGNKSKSKNTILYIHGGAFVNEVNLQHLFYSYILSRKLNAYVLVPVYPLTPDFNYSHSFKLIEELYACMLDEYDNIIFMGDSAGGGFIFSFCQYLNEINLKQPNQIVAFSPWVDISMSGEYSKYKFSDPILGEIGLKNIGKSWAGNLNTTDYKVSPLFGDNKDLANTLIFTGTNELFYPDIKKYAEKLKNSGVNVKLIEKEGMFHIYPMFPIPEAKQALNQIIEYVKFNE